MAATIENLAIPRGLCLPRLDGVPVALGGRAYEAENARLALALLDAGVAGPEGVTLWKRARGSAPAFVGAALKAWVDAHGGPRAATRFDLYVGLGRSIDGYKSMEDDDVGERADVFYLWLAPVEKCGYLELDPVVSWLERAHPRLPSRLWHSLMGLGRLFRLYTHHEAIEFEDMMEDGVDEEELAEYRKHRGHCARDLVSPALKRDALGASGVARHRAHWPRPVRAAVDAMADLDRAVARCGRPPRYDGRGERYPRVLGMLPHGAFEDHGAPRPMLSVVWREHDAVCTAFDEEMNQEAQLGEMSEPSCAWRIAAPTVGAVRVAFDGLARVLEVLAACAALADALPGQAEFRTAGEPLARVLASIDDQGPEGDEGPRPAAPATLFAEAA